MKILIKAPPRTGKSTLLNKIRGLFPDGVSGLVVEEILDSHNQRIGFKAVVFPSRQEFVIAHITDIDSSIRLSKYSIDVSAIESSLKMALQNTGEIILIDEIGRMQSHSSFFLQQINDLLDPSNPDFVIATIVYDDEQFARPFKDNPDTIVLELSVGNRDEMPSLIQTLYENRKYYEALTKEQKYYFDPQLEHYVRSGDMIMARKIIKRSLWYLIEQRVKRSGSNFLVQGEHGEHRVSDNTCNCTLFNAQGQYVGRYQQDCSHIQAVELFKKSSHS